MNNINRIKKKLNPSVEIDGILITMLNERTNLSKNMLIALKQSIELIKDKFNLEIKMFEIKIPISVRTGEAILNKKSIIEYNPKNKVSEAYKDFAREWTNEKE